MTATARLWLRLALFALLGLLASWLIALVVASVTFRFALSGSLFLLIIYGAALAGCVAMSAVLNIWRREWPITILASLLCLIAPAFGLYAAIVTFYANWPGNVSPI